MTAPTWISCVRETSSWLMAPALHSNEQLRHSEQTPHDRQRSLLRGLLLPEGFLHLIKVVPPRRDRKAPARQCAA